MDRKDFLTKSVTGAAAIKIFSEAQLESLGTDDCAAYIMRYKGKEYALGFKFSDFPGYEIREPFLLLQRSMEERFVKTVLFPLDK